MKNNKEITLREIIFNKDGKPLNELIKEIFTNFYWAKKPK